MRYRMRYESDINTAQQVEINMPRGCSMITRRTWNSIGKGSSPLGSSNFWFLYDYLCENFCLIIGSIFMVGSKFYGTTDDGNLQISRN